MVALPVRPKPDDGTRERLRTAIWTAFRQHFGPVAIAVAFFLAAIVVGRAFGLSAGTAVRLYLPTYGKSLPVSLALILVWHALFIAAVQRPARPLTVLVRDVRDRFLTVERLAVALPILLIMPLFGGSFTLFKSLIPAINPYSWDPTFASWDEALHFGIAPWELLQPVLGHPLATRIVNWLYNLWFVPLWFVWVWQAFRLHDRHLRLQFFYSLLLIWILLGVVAATIFSSAGPCYYGRLFAGPDPFAPLMDYLHIADARYEVWALTAQELLWGNYTTSRIEIGGGISAMPSMHIAMVFIFMLLGFRTARWLGWLFLAYFVAIQIGSVHLAWHYAIDGYFAAIGAAIVWWISGRLAGLTHPRQPALARRSNSAAA
jgi:hypothetical protein